MSKGTFKPKCVEEKDARAGSQEDNTSGTTTTTTSRTEIWRIRDRFFRVFISFFWSLACKISEMSNVQLSSSALERLVARRTFPLHRRTSVCRNLFGPVDHDEVGREMKAKLREICERDRQRWNFDFEANTPLDGDYKWEEVPVERTPVFYREIDRIDRSRMPATPVKQAPFADSCVLPESPRMDVLERLAMPESSSSSSGGSSGGSSPSSTAEVNQENRADKLNSGKPSHRQGTCVRRKSPADNTTHITDFFVKRKRTADRKSNDVSACHHSKSPISVEHTPRKRIR